MAQSRYEAALARGQRPNHVRHLILTILTLGLWSIGWVTVSIRGGEKYRLIKVDEYGNTSIHPYT